MTEINSCVEKDALIDYLYGEADAGARTRVEAHLRTCRPCADEVRGLEDVRGTLEVWVPPEAELGFRVVSDARPEPAPVSFWSRRRPPVWGLATAAVLVLAVAAALVRPEVTFERGGMVLRFGWSEVGSEAALRSGEVAASPSAPALQGNQPRPEIAALRGTPVGAGSRSRDLLPASRGTDVLLGPGDVADEWLLRVGSAPDSRVQVEEFAEQWRDDLTALQRVFAEFEVTPELAGPQLLNYLCRVGAIPCVRAGANDGPRP